MALKIFRLSAAALALFVGLAAPDRAATAPDRIGVTFELNRVDDNYAINLPVFRQIFRMLDLGYAGCSIEIKVRTDERVSTAGLNRKIDVAYEVKLNTEKAPFTNKVVGSLDRGKVVIYVYEKCSRIEMVRIASVGCFSGFKSEYSKLDCPYRFGAGEFMVRNFYLYNRRS